MNKERIITQVDLMKLTKHYADPFYLCVVEVTHPDRSVHYEVQTQLADQYEKLKVGIRHKFTGEPIQAFEGATVMFSQMIMDLCV